MWFPLSLAYAFISLTSAKIYDRCELARELVEKHEAPMRQVPTWVCIAQHESQFNTSAVGMMNGDESKDHGIFQISDLFWCSPPGKGWACGVTCAELEDDDIEDDFVCARRIYREHKKLSGDGFNAWVVYHTHCNQNVQSYIEGCFNKTEEAPKLGDSSTTTSPLSSTTMSPVSSSATSESTSTTTTEATVSSTFKTEFRAKNTVTSVPDWFRWLNRFRVS